MGREIVVQLPTFHAGQLRAYQVFKDNKRVAGRCGRRWGKTDLGKILASDYAVKGRYVGWFAPSYKVLVEAYSEIAASLLPVKLTSSKTEGIIRTIPTEGRSHGGRIDFWTLENENAGRSRKYHLVIIDEGAFTKANMMKIWEQSIEPTLLDYAELPYGGRCLVLSNTNGIDKDNFLYQICEPLHKREMGTPGKKYGFAEFHAPTEENPYMSKGAIELLRQRKHPLVFKQEYLAEFVDWSGVAFFQLQKMLVDTVEVDGVLTGGTPVNYPTACKFVVAVIDTAVKTGSENDGTGVSYYAVMHDHFDQYRMVILDWDIAQITGALLAEWMPSVYRRLNELSKACSAQFGSIGAYIEDRGSGSVLLQQCVLRGWDATPLPEELTAKGKDERAMNAVDPVFRGEVKISYHAHDKTSTYKEETRNHFVDQIVSFRIGDPDAAKRADDLLDTFTYSIAINLGGPEGTA